MKEKIVKLIGLHCYEACDTSDVKTCRHHIDKAIYLMSSFGEELDSTDILMLQDVFRSANHHYVYLKSED